MNQEFPSFINFENEKGCILEKRINYEWKPIKCANCNEIGHSEETCFNKEIKRRRRKCGYIRRRLE